ncbi:putative immunoglobulin variable region used by the ITC63B heavy [Rosellinia necatrix]|uniref:Putative immunoglobulin variable region used by the ITC63B heavy n=1 Tax=Rosellinia necatrix TaxID=77044 RepID=A0A1W2TUN6_ROSNE|nr:putative immunoglobulin variable region used by the ITC63B heavy [Rosellinia necatrix]
MDDLVRPDPVRPNPEAFRETYEAAFANENPALPASCLLTKDLFRQHPYFPPRLRLKPVQPAGHNASPRLYATGHSTWGSPPCKDDVDFSSFQQQLDIEVATSVPVALSIAEPAHSSNPPWFIRSDRNYIRVGAIAMSISER